MTVNLTDLQAASANELARIRHVFDEHTPQELLFDSARLDSIAHEYRLSHSSWDRDAFLSLCAHAAFQHSPAYKTLSIQERRRFIAEADRDSAKGMRTIETLLNDLEAAFNDLPNLGAWRLANGLKEAGVHPEAAENALNALRTIAHNLANSPQYRLPPGRTPEPSAMLCFALEPILQAAGISRKPASRIIARVLIACGIEGDPQKLAATIEQRLRNREIAQS